MIYGSVFAAGSVALTRASKALHSDTERALYRHGVYRVYIGPNHVNSPTDWETHAWEAFPDKSIAKVQNLQVMISFDYDPETGLSAYALGFSLGTSCRAIHAQLANSFISCTNYDAVFPRQPTISRTGFENLKCNNTEFLDRLRDFALDWYLECRTSSGRRWLFSENLYDAEVAGSIAQYFGFVDGCFPRTKNPS